jgi:hypothetical protein
MDFDPARRTLSLTNGDGSARHTIKIPFNQDAYSVYRAQFDGWQHIEAGSTQVYHTWIFASPARSLYDAQLAAHLALANARGFNHSALEAISRNTSYLLLRRNLLRPESDFIFISGISYGWKQWVSDGFWASRGLGDPTYDAQAQAAVFSARVGYEDNSQYFLIWSALAKREGGNPDMRLVKRAYAFIRSHERDGLYTPPRLSPDSGAMKTYFDDLVYDDDDSPASDQGLQCGALMAARELGLPATEADIQRSMAGYRLMFNAAEGFFATSLKQKNHVGQDALLGDVLAYCAFGRKLLPDAMVRAHVERSARIQSKYGLRDISNPDGSLLPGHAGVYTHGGSWFLVDGADYLAGLIHGMDPAWIEDRLLGRLEEEFASEPAFHEDIDTTNGRPHGNDFYSWNSGFWWMCGEACRRTGTGVSDHLAERLDEALGVKSRDGTLVLDPATATLRPPASGDPLHPGR